MSRGIKLDLNAGTNRDKNANSGNIGVKLQNTIAGITTGSNFNISSSSTKLSFIQLCDRYENNFEFDQNQDEALAKKIAQYGLQNEPIVVRINDYLKFRDISNKAKVYYEKKKSEGYTHYIISGHRRCRAIKSLCYGKTVGLDDSEFMSWYRNEFANINNNEKAAKNVWSVVSVKLFVPESVEQEEELTQIENFSSRIIQTFTWVYNAYKLIDKKEKATAENVTKYVNKNHGVDLKSKHIGNYLTIIRTFQDESYIDAIFAGKLSPRYAKDLIPIYKKKLANNDALRKEVLEKLCDKNTVVKDYLNELQGKKSKPKKPAKAKLTKDVVLELCNKIANSEMTVNEVIEHIKNNY